jgi:hypothetical protein
MKEKLVGREEEAITIRREIHHYTRLHISAAYFAIGG